VQKTKKNFQLLYQITNCLWLLTYNKTVAARVGDETAIIAALVDIVRDVTKEKVIRMAIGTFRVST
jgi:hypothetical protein